MVRFRVGGTWLGVPVNQVETIGALGPVTPLPMVPPHLIGLTPVEGEVFVLLDMAAFLGMADFLDEGEPERVVVLRSASMHAAVPVTATAGLLEVAETAMHSPDVLKNGRVHDFLLGEVNSDLGRMGVLDVGRLLEAARV